MDILKVFRDFCQELQVRDTHLTEDGIRYTLYSCMLKQDNILNHYVLELPFQSLVKVTPRMPHILSPSILHSKNSRLEQELDLFYDDGLSDTLCVELKFHRNLGNSATAKTSAAGELFNDIQRLQLLQPPTSCKRLFVYIADDEMHNYLSGKSMTGHSGGISNPTAKKQLGNFYSFSMSPFQVDLVDKKDAPDSFFSSAFNSFRNKGNVSVQLKMLFYCDFPCPALSGLFHVRVYEVL